MSLGIRERRGPVVNLATYPNAYRSGSGTLGFSNTRYGADSTYTTLSGLTGIPVTQGVRLTWKTTNRAGRGFDLVSNPDVTNAATAMTCLSNTRYFLSTYSKYSTTQATLGGYWQLKYYDSGGAAISSPTFTFTFTNNAWQRYSCSFITPSNCVKFDLTFRVSTAGTAVIGDTLDCAALMLTTSSLLQPYGDGTIAGWTWLGTAQASQSRGWPQLYLSPA